MNNFHLGIDVSKGYADFIILDSNKEVIEKNFQLDDTFDGHCRLYQRLKLFFKNYPDAQLYAAVESTGGYENNWYNALLGFQSSLNIHVARLNPAGVHSHSKAELQRNITDAASARNIAEYMIAHHDKIVYENDDPLATVRRQWTFVKMLIKQKTQLLNQLNSVMYIACPELLSYCTDGVPKWILRLLTDYPTCKRLARAKAAKVARIPYVSMSRAMELVEKARKSVASASDEATESIIKDTVKQIFQLEKTIDKQLKLITKSCSIPEIELLKTFPGIGDQSAIGLLIEIQTVKRFPSVKNLTSFFGLHPVYKKSGDGVVGIRMSKQGRKAPRDILFNVARNAIIHNPYIKEIYQIHQDKGMCPMAAIGVCMHKILRIIYGMLKNNQPFDPEIDRKHRQRSLPKKQKSSKNKVRRYQVFDSNAPISGRQARKRKEWVESHWETNPNSGINTPTPSSEKGI